MLTSDGNVNTLLSVNDVMKKTMSELQKAGTDPLPMTCGWESGLSPLLLMQLQLHIRGFKIVIRGMWSARNMMVHKRNAFSLIEVALAMGIVSFGLLVAVGMLPIGLKSLSESMDDSVKTQINQQISGKLLIIPYQDVDSFVAQGPFFFTEEGILQTSKDSTTFYQVDLLRVDPDYPGVSGLSAPEKERLRDNSLTTIKVAISKIGGYGSVGTSVTAAPFSPASLAATPAPSYQVIQVANSFGNIP
jgi:uncharacterized protein (TIGR02598 family)